MCTGGSVPESGRSCDNDDVVLSIPLLFEHDDELEPESIVLIVEGSAVGEPVRFVVDTGATRCSVHDSGAISELVGIGADSGRGASGTVSGDDIVIIDKITVGELTLRSVSASRTSRSRPLLGMNALSELECHFRFSCNRLDVDTSTDSSDCERALVRHPGGSPIVDVDFGTVATRAVWDTGASLTVADAAFARAHPDLFELGVDGSGFDAVGAAVSGPHARLASCTIGGTPFEASACIVIDLAGLNSALDEPINLIVGMPIIRRADWCFNFRANVWNLTIGTIP